MFQLGKPLQVQHQFLQQLSRKQNYKRKHWANSVDAQH